MPPGLIPPPPSEGFHGGQSHCGGDISTMEDDGAASKKMTTVTTKTTEVDNVGEGTKMAEIDCKESADINNNDKDTWAKKHPCQFSVMACFIKSCECFCSFLCFPCKS